MRKLLYLAAGAALLSAPAAFAQNDSMSQGAQPAPPAASSDQGAAPDRVEPSDSNQAMPTDQGPSSDRVAPSGQAPQSDEPGAPPSADQGQAVDQSQSQAQSQGQYTSPGQPAPGYYTQTPQGQGPDQNIQGQAPDQGVQAQTPDQGVQAQTPDQSTQGQAPGGSVGSDVRAQSGSRLYVQNGEYQGQSVQIISNAPVPDTRAVRRQFPPLSRAGRATRPAGN
jgi:hypothetical protein